MAGIGNNRLLSERAAPRDGQERGKSTKDGRNAGPARTVTVNLAESPLGWLLARGLVTERQFEAGERLRADWERAQLAPRVTMNWNAPPNAKVARSAPDRLDPALAQISAKQRFEAAVRAAGPGLSDILWRVVCAGEGMRDAERALGWPARAGKLVLCLGLDRVADFYRVN